MMLKTPDPFMTQEQFAALVATIITNLIVLFELDVTDARRSALLALVNSLYTIFVLVHAAIVRHGRASGDKIILPADGEDPGDAEPTPIQ